MRLTTKPGHSAQRTGIFLIACAKLAAAWAVSGEVSSPSMTSIRRMNDAGQKKWKPTTLSGRLVASAISVIESPEVLEARIAWPGVDGVELREDRVLDLHLLRDGLDHEVDVAEVVVGGRAGDQPERVLDLRRRPARR